MSITSRNSYLRFTHAFLSDYVLVNARDKVVSPSRNRSTTDRRARLSQTVFKRCLSTTVSDGRPPILRTSKVLQPISKAQNVRDLLLTRAPPSSSYSHNGYGLRAPRSNSATVKEPLTTNDKVEKLRQISFKGLQKEEGWQLQKEALKKKFQHTRWLPRKRLSPAALEGIRAIHAQYPNTYTTPVLAEKFKVSPEAVRRILKSKWRPNENEERERQRRWDSRGKKIWTQMVDIGLHPPRRWRELGIELPEGQRKYDFLGVNHSHH